MNQTKTIRVVYVEPDKCARVMDLGTELEDMQRAVGIICNEEGKCNGMHPNRAVYDDNKEMLDVIFGPFFICDCSGENFGSLSDEQIETYKNLFRKPERFFVRNNKIVAVPYMPAAAKTDREER